MDLYGSYRPVLEKVMNHLVSQIENLPKTPAGEKLFEHLSYRVKSDESASEKLAQKGFEITKENALSELRDSIGIRLVCLFVDDVYECVRLIKTLSDCRVVSEKDYRHGFKE